MMTTTKDTKEEQRLRVRFTLFVKILFKLLAESQDDLLLEQAKLTVFVCTSQAKQQQQLPGMVLSSTNMRRAPMTKSLRNDVNRKLYELIGEPLWSKAESYTRIYEARRATATAKTLIHKQSPMLLYMQQQEQQHVQQLQQAQERMKHSDAVRQALARFQFQAQCLGSLKLDVIPNGEPLCSTTTEV